MHRNAVWHNDRGAGESCKSKSDRAYHPLAIMPSGDGPVNQEAYPLLLRRQTGVHSTKVLQPS